LNKLETKTLNNYPMKAYLC